jgi:hypothetical protein
MQFLPTPSLSLRAALKRSALVEWRDGNASMVLYGPIEGGYRMTYWVGQQSYPCPTLLLEQCETTLRSIGIPVQSGWDLPKRSTGRTRR